MLFQTALGVYHICMLAAAHWLRCLPCSDVLFVTQSVSHRLWLRNQRSSLLGPQLGKLVLLKVCGTRFNHSISPKKSAALRRLRHAPSHVSAKLISVRSQI